MNYNYMDEIIYKQREFFATGRTLNVETRIKALIRLKKYILKYESQIKEALKKDLGKSSMESYMTEIGLALNEIGYMIRHINSFSKEKVVKTPLVQFHAKSYVKPCPYGVTLIISPWNYPFLLTVGPMINAIAAGNTVIIKPSEFSNNTSEVFKQMIRECFKDRYVAVILGGIEENLQLLERKFDYIFFTGSINVGKIVMEKAAKHLTPVTLELGGKSPCIVHKSANIRLAAKRIVFGKFLNCGQICIAPDYILYDASIKDELIAEIKLQIKKQFGEQPLLNENYGKIINKKHYDRLMSYIDSDKVMCGGHGEEETLRIEPTVMDSVTFEDAVMQDEIFGPILPMIEYKNIREVVERIESKSHPLALYLFASDQKVIRYVTTKCRFGGGCINDTIIHIATSEMGFGGVGESGMGAYHGKVGFDTFSHKKSIVDKKTWIDIPLRYQPYTKISEKIARLFLQ